MRNDSTSSIVVGYRDSTGWHEVTIETGKDAKVSGDRVRVSKNRSDNAVITVEYPVKAAKKYRILWSAQAEMWDFAAAGE